MEILWKLFGSHKNVVDALIQSKGYDMAPQVIQLPANSDAVPQGTSSGLVLETEEDLRMRIARISE